MSNINADRSHRCLVPHTEPDGMRKIRRNVLETHVGIDVPGIIKSRAAQASTYKRCGTAKRKAQLGIQNNKLLASYRHRNLFATTWVGRRTYQDLALWSRAVQAQSPKRTAAAGEKALADGNVSAPKCMLHSQPETIGPNQRRI